MLYLTYSFSPILNAKCHLQVQVLILTGWLNCQTSITGYQLSHGTAPFICFSLYCSFFFFSIPTHPIHLLSFVSYLTCLLPLSCLAACLGSAFVHKQVSIMSAKSGRGQTIRLCDRGAGRKERLCRKDAEGKVKAVVRAGIIYTVSCCFLPVRHVHRGTQCEISANQCVLFWCIGIGIIGVICLTYASVLPICMNIWR